MIYTWRPDHNNPPSAAGVIVDVDYDYRFTRSDAMSMLKLSESSTLGFRTRNWWWAKKHRQFAMLLDFLCFRGEEIIHHVGPFTATHTSYFSGAGGRMEKLYDPETLDIWREFD